jgi:hypothetical protein
VARPKKRTNTFPFTEIPIAHFIASLKAIITFCGSFGGTKKPPFQRRAAGEGLPVEVAAENRNLIA